MNALLKNTRGTLRLFLVGGLMVLFFAACHTQKLGVLPPAIFYVEPTYHVEKDFMRITEYFTGEENTGAYRIVRTRPEERAGMYFIVSLNEGVNKLPAGTKVKLEYIDSSSPEQHVFEWVLPQEPVKKHSDLWLGVTGKDWPGRDITVTAWQVTLMDFNGNRLASKCSFLWK